MTEKAPSQADWDRYFRTAFLYQTQLTAVERLLESQADGNAVEVEETGRRVQASYDQVFEILSALSGVGLFKRSGSNRYTLEKAALQASRAERQAASAALRWARENVSTDLCELLLGTPAGGQSKTSMALDRSFLDLRTSLRSLIASTGKRLLLASPFWDTLVAEDLAVLLERRLEAGVQICILARAPTGGNTNRDALRILRAVRCQGASCDIRILEQPSSDDPFGRSTFHFKVACSDGERVYLGSANFNTAGLASRWELGVLLEGTRGRLVSSLVESLLGAATPVTGL
jgi:phosphatidylserine/phosphatidylglycerophosphate/cardiolipin synthase-like enzyme